MTCKVKCNMHLLKSIKTQKEIKQGGIPLPPLPLLNFYTNSIVRCPNNSNIHSPQVMEHSVALLLLADNAVVISRTPVNFKRALKHWLNTAKMII